MSITDLSAPRLADNPPEWPEVTAAVREFLDEHTVGGILRHLPACRPTMRHVTDPLTGLTARFPREWACAAGCPVVRRDRIARDRWFLMRQDVRYVCGKCGAKHRYFTCGCVELPFNGISQIYGFLVKELTEEQAITTIIDAVRLGFIEPVTRERARENFARMVAKGYRLA